MAFERPAILYNATLTTSTQSEVAHFIRASKKAVIITFGTITGGGSGVNAAKLDVEIQWSHDGVVFATTLPSDTLSTFKIGDSGLSYCKVFTSAGPYVRANFTVTGTNSPSFPAKLSAYGTR